MAANIKIDAMLISQEIIKLKHYERRIPNHREMSPALLLEEVKSLVQVDQYSMLSADFRVKYQPYIKRPES